MGLGILSVFGIASITILLGMGMAPAMAESSPLKLVADSNAPEGQGYVSVDFDQDGICDEQAVLISIVTIEKVGIDEQCVLPSI